MDAVLERKLVVEFVGMFLFMFTVGMATNKAGAGAFAPLAIGSVLMVMVFAGGHVSGGHFNPAVSTAVFLRRRMAGNEFAVYVVTQFVAAIIAGLVVRYVGGREAHARRELRKDADRGVPLHIRARVGRLPRRDRAGNLGQLLLRARHRVHRRHGAFAVGGISGGAFNPAIAVGAMVTGLFEWSKIWIYLIADSSAQPSPATSSCSSYPARKRPETSRPRAPSDGRISRAVQG